MYVVTQSPVSRLAGCMNVLSTLKAKRSKQTGFKKSENITRIIIHAFAICTLALENVQLRGRVPCTPCAQLPQENYNVK